MESSIELEIECWWGVVMLIKMLKIDDSQCLLFGGQLSPITVRGKIGVVMYSSDGSPLTPNSPKVSNGFPLKTT